MANILVVPHPTREKAAELAQETIKWLVAHGHGAFVLEVDAVATGLMDWSIPGVDAVELDLAVSFGGDGTMLRALDLVCSFGVPVLGVNVGHLGYLTEVEPGNVRDAFARFFAGDYHVEERLTVEVTVTAATDNDPTGSTLALARGTAVNDVVVEKVSSGHTVRIQTIIDGRPFLSYAVDGMIVATPTGSTAYNLSARGPILSPTLKAFVMTPVSPHMLFDRALVLDGNESLDLRVVGREPASVVVDGRHVATIGSGGTVACRQATNPARIATFIGRDFRNILKTKFGLTDR